MYYNKNLIDEGYFEHLIHKEIPEMLAKEKEKRKPLPTMDPLGHTTYTYNQIMADYNRSTLAFDAKYKKDIDHYKLIMTYIKRFKEQHKEYSSDVSVYTKCLISKQQWHNITDPKIKRKPSVDVCICLALGLELSLKEALQLFQKCGHSLRGTGDLLIEATEFYLDVLDRKNKGQSTYGVVNVNNYDYSIDNFNTYLKECFDLPPIGNKILRG